AVARRDARHARAVAVAILAVAHEDAVGVRGARARADEVNGGGDARPVVLLEVGVRGADAAVYDRDADALAGHARHALKTRLRECSARRLAGHGQLPRDLSVGR